MPRAAYRIVDRQGVAGVVGQLIARAGGVRALAASLATGGARWPASDLSRLHRMDERMQGLGYARFWVLYAAAAEVEGAQDALAAAFGLGELSRRAEDLSAALSAPSRAVPRSAAGRAALGRLLHELIGEKAMEAEFAAYWHEVANMVGLERWEGEPWAPEWDPWRVTARFVDGPSLGRVLTPWGTREQPSLGGLQPLRRPVTRNKAGKVVGVAPPHLHLDLAERVGPPHAAGDNPEFVVVKRSISLVVERGERFTGGVNPAGNVSRTPWRLYVHRAAAGMLRPFQPLGDDPLETIEALRRGRRLRPWLRSSLGAELELLRCDPTTRLVRDG